MTGSWADTFSRPYKAQSALTAPENHLFDPRSCSWTKGPPPTQALTLSSQKPSGQGIARAHPPSTSL